MLYLFHHWNGEKNLYYFSCDLWIDNEKIATKLLGYLSQIVTVFIENRGWLDNNQQSRIKEESICCALSHIYASYINITVGEILT